jgi:putative endopeptidase
MLRVKTEHQLKVLVDDVVSHKKRVPGSPEQMIADLYTSGMDMKRRNSLGLTPLAPYLWQIENVSDTAELALLVQELHKIGVGVLFDISVDQDAKNSEKYILYAGQDGLGMPDSDYYLKTDAESLRVKKAYLPYVTDVLRLSGMEKRSADAAAKRIFDIETQLAKCWMNKVDRRDIDKIYNKMSLSKWKSLTPQMDFAGYLKSQGVADVHSLIVMQPKYFIGLERLLQRISVSDWKLYMRFHLVNDFAGALSTPFVKRSFEFYGKTLSGVQEMKPLWRRTLSAVNGTLGEQLGKLYVERYFDDESKKKMNLLVDDLFAAYKHRIQQLDWMSPRTQKKALEKLSLMSRKIGYPKKWKSYAGLRIEPDDYVGNILRATTFEHKRAIKKLRGKVDRDEWFMYPQTVNAYNAPTLNDIAFPAAILQPPFFDPSADDALNYGSIGSVIGHEMTHGFDDEGAKFDGKGNLHKWWTTADEKRFKQKGAVLAKQYDAYQLHGVHVNGKLTLGENIADLGGATIAFEAYQRRLKKTGRKDIAGLTPEQRFFLGFALFERELARSPQRH